MSKKDSFLETKRTNHMPEPHSGHATFGGMPCQ